MRYRYCIVIDPLIQCHIVLEMQYAVRYLVTYLQVKQLLLASSRLYIRNNIYYILYTIRTITSHCVRLDLQLIKINLWVALTKTH